MASHADSAHDLLDLDISTLREFVHLFPNEGLAKVVTGYLSSGISKHPLTDDENTREGPDLSEGGVALTQDVPVTQEDCLVLMTVREDSPRPILAHIQTVMHAHSICRKAYQRLKSHRLLIVCLETSIFR